MTDDLDLLQARLDALKAARRAQRGELPMYEHGRPVMAYEADKPIPYRLTAVGLALLRGGALQKGPLVDSAGWDANGSPVEGER